MAVLLADHVGAHPDEVAIVDERGTRTWAELDARVDRLVNALRARGLGEGDVVALMGGNHRETVEVSLACLHGGFLMVPVNWHWVAAELAHVITDAGARAVIVGGAWIEVSTGADELAPGDRVRIAISDDAPHGYERYEDVLAGAPGTAPEDQTRGGTMFYTSGTTGHPKGVRGGLAGTGGPAEVFAFVAAAIADLIENEGDGTVQLVCGPMYHSAQWVFAMVPLLRGGRLVLQHRFDPAGVLSLIDEHGVTNTHLVPAQFVRLLGLDDEVRSAFSGASLRRVHHGAAPCAPEVKRRMIEWWGPIITEYYGGTEGGFLTKIDSQEWLERPASVGRAYPIVEIIVVGSDGRRLGPGEAGDLYFRSLIGQDFEYHNAEEKTEAAHLEEGVGTLGDIGWLDVDGFLFLSDRRIDMIISGGVNIYPAEIEGVLAGHPAVADVAVFGIPHEEMGEQVMAALELHDGPDAGDTLRPELEAYAREHLAGYKVPRAWSFLEELPRSEAGKLVKRTLRDPYWQGADRAI